MKSIFFKIKSVIPYLSLIALYFFFINLEARKNKPNNETPKTKQSHITENIDKTIIRIKIPVLPFNE